jgi:erythrocyte band 7 integral membrane protein
LNGLGSVLGFCGAIPCCPCPNPFRNVQQGTFTPKSSLHIEFTPITGSVGLVSRFGQFYKSVDPGLVQVNICTESLRIVDVKIQISPIGRQTVITRDNVNVEMCAISQFQFHSANHLSLSDSVIYFQIVNPYRAAFGISDLRQALIERAQTTLRHVVGARAVQSVVTEREAIAFEIAEIVGDVADKWGVAIEGILIKDIIFSAEVSASLSSAAQQKRIGESKVIAARAEVDSARLMRQAADILASPAAMQIRQLEALQQMAKSANSKVVFVPMQLASDVVGQMSQQQQQGTSSAIQSESGEGVSSVGRAGLLNAIAET